MAATLAKKILLPRAIFGQKGVENFWQAIILVIGSLGIFGKSPKREYEAKKYTEPKNPGLSFVLQRRAMQVAFA